MEPYRIVKDTATSIRAVSKEIPAPYGDDVKDLLRQMDEYLRESQDPAWSKRHRVREGIGLACPQIGRNIRAFVVRYTDKDENGNDRLVRYGLINPRIIAESVKLSALAGGEGCLSVDASHEGYVYRHYKILVKAYDVFQDKEIVITARGLLAIVLQHENDHLDGILYYDRIDAKDPMRRLPNSVLI